MNFEEVRGGPLDYLVSRPETGASGLPLLVGLCDAGSDPNQLTQVASELGAAFVHVLPKMPGREWGSEGCSLLLALLDALRRQTGAGPESTGVWGFADGGSMALELGIRAASPLAAAVSVNGQLEPATVENRALLRQARGRDFFLVHGVRDEIIPFARSQEAYSLLTGQGARVEFAQLPMAHEINVVALGAMRGYLMETVGKRGIPARA